MSQNTNRRRWAHSRRTEDHLYGLVHFGTKTSSHKQKARRAPALNGGINASDFLFASHSFEIGRIGGILLLRAQSASCIVHCTVPRGVCPHIAPAVRTGIDPGRQSVDLGRRPTGIDAKAGCEPNGHSSFADGAKRLTGSARCSAIRSALPGIALVLCPSNA